MTKMLRLSSERMAAEVISKKKVDLQGKIRSLCLQFLGASPYGDSHAPLLLNSIRLANPLLKYANVCGPPVVNQWTREIVARLNLTMDRQRCCVFWKGPV